MVETKDCYLRKFKIEDAEAMFNNWANDAEVTKYLSWNPHGVIEVTKDYLSTIIAKNTNDYAIVRKDNDEVIGSIGLVHESVDYYSCEIGYCLSKKYWNQGIMTSVLREFVKYLFEVSNYQMVAIKHIKENLGSRSVIEKNGFRFVGVVDHLFDKLGWCTLFTYQLTYDEFKMFQLTNKLKSFFDMYIPFYLDINSLVTYLCDNEFLVKKVVLFDDSRINSVVNHHVFIHKVKEYNLVYYYFICLKRKVFEYNKAVHYFLTNNHEYIVSDNNKSLELQIIQLLKKNNLHISCAESCTGGLICSTLIDISGASDVINESYVTYSEDAKTKILGVKKETLTKYSVYSKEVAKEMAHGLYLRTGAELCLSITGRAGGNVQSIDNGKFDFCLEVNIMGKRTVICETVRVTGSRNIVRKKQTIYCLFRVLKFLKALDLSKY